MHLLSVLVVLATTLATTLGYKVLVVAPVPTRSHDQLAKAIVEALLKAGHEVTWATPYPENKKFVNNLKIVDVSATRPIIETLDLTIARVPGTFVKQMAMNISTVAIQTKALRDTLTNEQFDAVVTEWFFSDIDAGYAAVQQVPWIMLSGNTLQPYFEFLVDEVRTLSTLPLFRLTYPIPMNFWQRTVNFGMYSLMFFSNWFELPQVAATYEQYFAPLAANRGRQLPPLQEAMHNISILLVNSHPSIAPAQSLPPNVIDIGGYHIDENHSPLPKDIQAIMDSSPQGVVYFSMGSIVRSSALPEYTRKYLIKILGELPHTVLWKFEEDIQGLPKNVHVRPWWPQPSVLAHPNIKLFITHGGLLSTLEAVHYGVPLLAIPVYGDQPNNANKAVQKGYARAVPFSFDMGPELRETLQEMLRNDSYYMQAKYLSKIFNSRPVPPSKLITHYVELAIESRGAYHLRSKTYQYAWYQRWMLDQLAALLAALWLLGLMLKTLLRTLCGTRQGKLKKN